jgi:hypothetical protein
MAALGPLVDDDRRRSTTGGEARLAGVELVDGRDDLRAGVLVGRG